MFSTFYEEKNEVGESMGLGGIELVSAPFGKQRFFGYDHLMVSRPTKLSWHIFTAAAARHVTSMNPYMLPSKIDAPMSGNGGPKISDASTDQGDVALLYRRAATKHPISKKAWGEHMDDNTSFLTCLRDGWHNVLNPCTVILTLLDSLKYFMFSLVDLGAEYEEKLKHQKDFQPNKFRYKDSESWRPMLKGFIIEPIFWLFALPFRLLNLLPKAMETLFNITQSDDPKTPTWHKVLAGVGLAVVGLMTLFIVACLAKATLGLAFLPKIIPALAKATAFVSKGMTFGHAVLSKAAATVTAKVCLFGTVLSGVAKKTFHGVMSFFSGYKRATHHRGRTNIVVPANKAEVQDARAGDLGPLS